MTITGYSGKATSTITTDTRTSIEGMLRGEGGLIKPGIEHCFDGGDLDGCYEAMDYLDPILDGGQL